MSLCFSEINTRNSILALSVELGDIGSYMLSGGEVVDFRVLPGLSDVVLESSLSVSSL